MKMLFLSVLLCAFAVWRMVLPLKTKWYFKVLIALPLLAGAFKFQIFRVIGGHYFSPALPTWIIVTGAWLYGAFYFVPPLLGTSEIVRFFKWRKEQPVWNKVNLAIACAALALSGTALVLGALPPVVTTYTVSSPQLPAKADGMTVAFITDLHIDRTTSKEKVRTLVSQVNALSPDLIALGGDLMDGKVSLCGEAVAELKSLKAPMGIWSVPGNHEFYSDAKEWSQFFLKTPVRTILNNAVELPNGVIIAGCGDQAARVFYKKNVQLIKLFGDNPEEALKKVPHEKFVLFLAHRPKIAARSSELGADLQLSGHTHGGMIRGFDLLVGLYNKGWISGRYQVKSMTLIVSNGTWLWKGFPLRLGRPGEILLVTLKKGS